MTNVRIEIERTPGAFQLRACSSTSRVGSETLIARDINQVCKLSFGRH